ncbi:MAG: hypothetical protein KatS3mg051_1473 [Anaerolineae bacterium]|nr:MAG: hypothetical protein KatS3mg051_1473 [Anaerolineae bacterium]
MRLLAIRGMTMRNSRSGNDHCSLTGAYSACLAAAVSGNKVPFTCQFQAIAGPQIMSQPASNPAPQLATARERDRMARP